MHESGVNVTVGLRKGGGSWQKAVNAGLKVAEVAEAVKGADVVMILLPDESIAEVYKNDVEANLKPGAALALLTVSTFTTVRLFPRRRRRYHGCS